MRSAHYATVGSVRWRGMVYEAEEQPLEGDGQDWVLRG